MLLLPSELHHQGRPKQYDRCAFAVCQTQHTRSIVLPCSSVHCTCKRDFVYNMHIRGRSGEIEDPCRCCSIDQIIKNVNGDPEFTAKGTICQLGFCCPCISDPSFAISAQ